MNSQMKQITRYGAYGIVMHNWQILLTQYKSGPFKGLWGLPGGGIEFGETPEEALKRELLEETAMSAASLEFSKIFSCNAVFNDRGESYQFHFTGIVYKVLDAFVVPHLIPGEIMRWANPASLDLEELTPLVQDVIAKIRPTLKGVWRPIDSIRTKVIGIARHQGQLLVCEALDDHGTLKGWCPPGGGVEFGESLNEALEREIEEELNCKIQVTGAPLVCENLFEHHGVKGHEVVVAFPIRFEDAQIYARKRFQIRESKGSLHWMEWIAIERFQSGEATLFPPTLLANFLNEAWLAKAPLDCGNG